MATRYVRKTGSDSNSGNSPAAAWATVGKALGGTGMSSGDTLYIGAGVYREAVVVSLTPATATNIIADVDGKNTGDVGEVRWTAYVTDDKTAPSSNSTLRLNGKKHLNFQNIVFVGGANSTAACVDSTTIKGSNNCSFKDCTFLPGSNADAPLIAYQLDNDGAFPPGGVIASLTIDRCRFLLADENRVIDIRSASLASEFDFNVLIQNCLIVGSSAGFGSAPDNGIISIFGDAIAQDGDEYPGGIRIYNNTCISGGTFVYATQVATQAAFRVRVYNNVLVGCKLFIEGLGTLAEDYNAILTSESALTGSISQGGHSITDGSYSMLLHLGQEVAQGRNLRHFAQPTADSPILGFGGLSAPTYDLTNSLRPAGARFWNNTSYAIGCLEYANGGVKETTTVRSSPSSLKLAGSGYNDFDFPVDPVQTTIGVWTYKDSNYTGTSPQMKVLNGTECGVTDSTVTAGASANMWHQVTLTFTPTAKGIVTIRLISNDTSITGNCYFDDFSVS